MTSSVHHIVADLAARLDFIESTLKEDYQAYATAIAEGNATSVSHDGTISENASAASTMKGSSSPQSSPNPNTNIAACRLNLSQRLASINNTFNKSLISSTATEIGDRLSYFSTVLLPSYISSEVKYEPDRLIDADVTAQRYAVVKRRLRLEGKREFEQLKQNIEALLVSAFAKDETGVVIADVLSYNGPSRTAADGSEVVGPTASGSSFNGAVKRTNTSNANTADMREWVNKAAANNKRAQALHLRLAKAKGRYESLVNYSNKQMCVWDLQIEELEKRARRLAAQRQ